MFCVVAVYRVTNHMMLEAVIWEVLITHCKLVGAIIARTIIIELRGMNVYI